MDYLLGIAANLASILTAVVAAIAYFGYQSRANDRRNKMEAYLRNDKANAKPGFHGQRTVLHLMAALKFTEDEVFQACFHSPHIVCKGKAEDGFVSRLLFEYDPKSESDT